MNEPLISVILPVYNGEKYLREAIQSILLQTITNFEFIIINDGSTDNTEKIILSIIDSRIIYLKNNVNLKLIKTLNKGVMFAKGKYISRMDADDIASSRLFEKQLEIFNKHSYVNIVNIRNFNLTENGQYYKKSNSIISVVSEVHQYIVYFQNLISHPGVMVDASLIKKHGYYDNDSVLHFEDVDLWQRLLKAGSYLYTLNKGLLFHRNNSTGIVNLERSKNLNRRLTYCEKVLNENGFKSLFKQKSIKIILGDYSLAGREELVLLNLELDKYLLKIRENVEFSKDGIRDFKFWKSHLLFIISIKSLKNKSFIKRFGLIIFILKNFPSWINNKLWRNNLIKGIFSTKRKFKQVILN